MTWEWLALWAVKSWTAIKVFLAVATSFVASITIYDKVVKPYRMRRKESMELLASANANMIAYFSRVDKLTEDIGVIRNQVLPNGGSSMNDKITNIDNNINVMRARQKHAFRIEDKAIFYADKEGKLTSVNNAFIDLFGADNEEQCLGHGTISFIDYSEHKRLYDLWDDALKNSHSLDLQYVIINRKTGEKIPVKSRSVFERVNGEVVTICGVVERL